MQTLHTLVIVVQILSALAIIGLVLLQHGKGADMGASFGSGASGSLFGATGSSNFMSKATGIAAAIFFAATLGLAVFSTGARKPSGGVMEGVTVVQPATNAAASAPASAPAVTAAPAPASSAGQSGQIPK
ncbi:preprotein translocase subunit SecG [Undibacterium pigrum]|uniref:Protein-export membrane protein SecG n=1 Tax=Undibacterium pigrum TaxID=401470 RepID=A0A318JF27_9BURK|nr:preprotein translocase subunit SecG [Undibacterium pigrum]PXX47621.1 protein translocase subunit secG [Undibacterium pigrum]